MLTGGNQYDLENIKNMIKPKFKITNGQKFNLIRELRLKSEMWYFQIKPAGI